MTTFDSHALPKARGDFRVTNKISCRSFQTDTALNAFIVIYPSRGILLDSKNTPGAMPAPRDTLKPRCNGSYTPGCKSREGLVGLESNRQLEMDTEDGEIELAVL